jgi:hypothetical protein
MAAQLEPVGEEVLRVLQTLPPEGQREVLDFARFVARRKAAARSNGGVPQRPDVECRAERQWLKEHGRRYAGQWVALDGERLIAHGVDAREVFAAVREAGLKSPFVMRVGGPEELPFGGW